MCDVYTPRLTLPHADAPQEHHDRLPRIIGFRRKKLNTPDRPQIGLTNRP